MSRHYSQHRKYVVILAENLDTIEPCTICPTIADSEKSALKKAKRMFFPGISRRAFNLLVNLSLVRAMPNDKTHSQLISLLNREVVQRKSQGEIWGWRERLLEFLRINYPLMMSEPDKNDEDVDSADETNDQSDIDKIDETSPEQKHLSFFAISLLQKLGTGHDKGDYDDYNK